MSRRRVFGRPLRGGDRMNPGWFHPRRYHLSALRDRLEEILREVDFEAVETVLDYGCGGQPYRPLFEGRCGRYVGADLPGSPDADVTLTEDGRLPLPDRSVDLVLSSQVLEHVPDPSLYLAEAHRVLVPGGVLILSTHGIWRYHPDPTDYWRWTADGLVRQVVAARFQVRSLSVIGNLANAAVQLWQDATRASVPRILRPGYVFALQALMTMLDRSYRRRSFRDRLDGQVFALLAVRPADRPPVEGGEC